MNKTLGERIESLRLLCPSPSTGRIPISQTELARELGITQSTMNTILNGSQKTSRYIPVFARYFGVNVLWLSTGAGPKYSTKVVDENGTDVSYAARLNPEMLTEAELLIGAAEQYRQRKFPLKERAQWLARAYHQLITDGGRLTAEHQAALFEDAKQGNAGGDTENE